MSNRRRRQAKKPDSFKYTEESDDSDSDYEETFGDDDVAMYAEDVEEIDEFGNPINNADEYSWAQENIGFDGPMPSLGGIGNAERTHLHNFESFYGNTFFPCFKGHRTEFQEPDEGDDYTNVPENMRQHMNVQNTVTVFNNDEKILDLARAVPTSDSKRAFALGVTPWKFIRDKFVDGGSTLFFQNGNCVDVGCKTVQHALITARLVVRFLRNSGYDKARITGLSVENIVASDSICKDKYQVLNTASLTSILGDHAIRGKFPAVPVRVVTKQDGLNAKGERPHITALMYTKGEIVLVGATSQYDVDRVFYDVIQYIAKQLVEERERPFGKDPWKETDELKNMRNTTNWGSHDEIADFVYEQHAHALDTMYDNMQEAMEREDCAEVLGMSKKKKRKLKRHEPLTGLKLPKGISTMIKALRIGKVDIPLDKDVIRRGDIKMVPRQDGSPNSGMIVHSGAYSASRPGRSGD